MPEDNKQFTVEAGDEGESISIAPKVQPKRTADGRIYCETCNMHLDTEGQWEIHVTSKKHQQKASRDDEGLFDIDDHDLYVDESTNAYRVIMGSKSRLAGAEYIVTEKESQETKCILCKAILKQAEDILKHMRSQKHIHAFVSNHFPDIFRSIQRKAKSKMETHSMILKYADDLVRQYGKKEPLLHEKGYYSQLTSDKKLQVDRHLEAIRREREDQKKCQLTDKEKPNPKRSRTRSRSRSPSRTRTRTRSPSARSSQRDTDKERDRDRHHYRPVRRSRSPPRRDRPRDRSPPPPLFTAERRSTTYYPSNERHKPRSRDSRPPEREPNVDEMEELPTDPDIFEILCKSEFRTFEPSERAYIQDLIDAIDGPIIGLEYMAEYSDDRGQYEPAYLCTLCQKRLNPPQAVQHAVSDKHTMAFMKEHYSKQYMALCIGTLGEEVRRQMKSRYLEEIASREQRKITQTILLPRDQRLVFRYHKRVATDTAVFDQLPQTSATSEPSRPMLIYSNRLEQAKQLLELEKSLPPYCEKNLEEGWYSIRKLSVDYYRKFAEPGASYFSIRDPAFQRLDLYGDWNPQLMRRLQDKFNFKLDHIRWLQKLLTDWRVPIATPLQKTDLRPLEQEVEAAVLNELLDKILKPVSVLRNIQVFEYERYDEEPVTKATETEPSQEPDQPASKKPRLDAPEPVEAEETEMVATNERDKAVLRLIDQILQAAKQRPTMNPVERLLVEMSAARAVLFRLATQQPKELQQLVAMSRDPKLVLQPQAVEQLRNKLQDVLGTGPEPTAAKDNDEIRKRIDEQRAQMLKNVQASSSQQKAFETIAHKTPSGGVHLLTPKLPGVQRAEAPNVSMAPRAPVIQQLPTPFPAPFAQRPPPPQAFGMYRPPGRPW